VPSSTGRFLRAPTPERGLLRIRHSGPEGPWQDDDTQAQRTIARNRPPRSPIGGSWYNPMTVAAFNTVDQTPIQHRHVRAPAPLCFPVEQSVPETGRHLEIRTVLYQIVRDALRDRAIVGSEQFIYWDPTDPRQCCAPDLFVRLGTPHTPVDSWKVWERGAPDLVVEITSASDTAEGPWETKLERFRRLGAREIVRFDPDDRERPIRIWDAVDGDAVERDSADPVFCRCETLGMYLVVVQDAEIGAMVRLAHDPEGRDRLPTAAEARQRESEARQQAERRLAEVEADLAKRR
jgi:Uma2 family endonuclease